MLKINLNYLLLLSLVLNYYDFPTEAYRVFFENGVEVIMATENETVEMNCKTDRPITYCGFIHNETRYSYAGTGTDIGNCGITIKAIKNQTGAWSCHIGLDPVGEEIMKNIYIRLTKQVAAEKKNIKVMHGKSVTFYCTTVKGFIPLKYCRIVTPQKYSFGINNNITEKNQFLNRYYFPANKSLDRGDCAVTIENVNYKDEGNWTCGAGFPDGNEYDDVINIKVEGFYTLSVVGFIAVTASVASLSTFLVILTIFIYRKRLYIGVRQEPESHELRQAPSRSSRQTTPDPRAIPTVVIQSPSDPGTGIIFM